MIGKAPSFLRHLLGIALAGALVALGCGGEKTETPAAATTPGAPAEPAPLRTPGPGRAGRRTLPDELPGGHPALPRREVVKAHSTPETGIEVSFSTPDDPAKVAAYYNDKFVAQGWSTQRVDAPDGTLVFADKGARSATVGIAPAKARPQIDLLVVEMR